MGRGKRRREGVRGVPYKYRNGVGEKHKCPGDNDKTQGEHGMDKHEAASSLGLVWFGSVWFGFMTLPRGAHDVPRGSANKVESKRRE